MGRKGVFTVDNLLSDEEINKLKTAQLNDTERLIIFGLLYTGMRVGEFIHMRADWIDWKTGVIKIPKTQECKCEECIIKRNGVWKPKTKNAVRIIPLLPNVFPILSEVLRKHFKTHKTIIEVLHNRAIVWYYIQSACKKAGIKHKVFPHVFRGNYVTELIANDIKEQTIKQVLGWTSIKMVDTYAKLSAKHIINEMQEKLKKQ